MNLLLLPPHTTTTTIFPQYVPRWKFLSKCVLDMRELHHAMQSPRNELDKIVSVTDKKPQASLLESAETGLGEIKHARRTFFSKDMEELEYV